MTFLTVFVASVLGQLTSLWVIGAIAHRREAERAERVREAFEKAVKESQKRGARMREYVKMES
jgi:membrane protein YqaA with SNARE-associated domain